MRYRLVHSSYFFSSEVNTILISAKLADGTFTKRGMSLTAFLNKANELIHCKSSNLSRIIRRHILIATANHLTADLTIHHTIEERHIFPVLAKRMPMFAMENDGVHLESHKGIHHGVPLPSIHLLVSSSNEDVTQVWKT